MQPCTACCFTSHDNNNEHIKAAISVHNVVETIFIVRMFEINITCFHKSLCLFEWNWVCWVLASLFWCLNVHWSHNDRSPGQKSLSIQDGRWKCKISIEHCKISIEHWISYDCTTAQSGGWLETVNWPQLDRCREAIVDFSIAMTVWQCRLQADWVMSLQNILHITCQWVCIAELVIRKDWLRKVSFPKILCSK